MAKKTSLHFDFPDFLALTIIVACFIMIAMGKNHYVFYVLASTCGYYFGHKH